MKHPLFLMFFLAFLISGCLLRHSTNTLNQPRPNSEANLEPTDQLLGQADDDSNFDIGQVNEATNARGQAPEEVAEVLKDDTSKIGGGQNLVPEAEMAIKPFIDYKVGFSSQAPFAVWDELHEETCEEAAMIMAVNYYRNEPVTPHIMEQGLLSLVQWETDRGYKVDLTALEVKNILADYFTVNSKIITDVSSDTIIAELNKGNLIIVPAAGRELANPYFQTPGPIYHMLVIRGYDQNKGEFITNDPGTKRGEAYRYKYSELLNAIHDWDHERAQGGMTDEEMALGSKIIISVGPNP